MFFFFATACYAQGSKPIVETQVITWVYGLAIGALCIAGFVTKRLYANLDSESKSTVAKLESEKEARAKELKEHKDDVDRRLIRFEKEVALKLDRIIESLQDIRHSSIEDHALNSVMSRDLVDLKTKIDSQREGLGEVKSVAHTAEESARRNERSIQELWRKYNELKPK